MNNAWFRPVSLAVLTLAGIASSAQEAPPAPFTQAELAARVEKYCAGDEAVRKEVLAELAGRDRLADRAAVQNWLKVILKSLQKHGPKWEPKKTDLLASPHLSPQAKMLGKQVGVGSAPVATVAGRWGEVRVAILGNPGKGKPVIVYLHGGGNVGRGGQHDNEMAWGWGMPRTRNMNAAPVKLLVRCPDDTAVNAWVIESGPKAVNDVLDAFFLAHPDINTSQVYLVGTSMGGFGAWYGGPIEADRFAAIAGIGGGCTSPERAFVNLRLLPTGIFIGEKDTASGRLTGSQRVRDALAALRQNEPNHYPAEYHEYPGMGHDYADKVYDDVDEFFKKKARHPYPRSVVWNPLMGWKKRFYNLRIESPSGGSVKAEMGADNTVTVTTEGVSAFTLFLNDDLANLAQPVKVVHNGREVGNGPVPRTLGTMLRTLGDRPDPGQFYTAAISLPVGR